MLKWFRARSAGFAGALLVSLATLGYSLAIPHEGHCQHDDECAIRFVEHDASAHGFESAPSTSEEPPLHCVLCHWTRSFRPSAASNHQGPAVDSRDVRFHVIDDAVSHSCPAAQPPLRSPPVSPALT